jgi:hypothetical protein
MKPILRLKSTEKCCNKKKTKNKYIDNILTTYCENCLEVFNYVRNKNEELKEKPKIIEGVLFEKQIKTKKEKQTPNEELLLF